MIRSNLNIKFFFIIKVILIYLFFCSKSYSGSIATNISPVVLGQNEAPVKIKIFSSLTCPHCAIFHAKIYPLLKKDYIDTGIAKIYFKHFPLDLSALNAAKIAQCVNKEKRISFLDHLYKTQESWVRGEKIEDINQNLKKSVKQFGLNEDDFDKCLAFEDVEDYILNSRIEAVQKFKIKSTPTLVINDEPFKDTLEYKNIKKMLEKLI